jgi:hypothetical protein
MAPLNPQVWVASGTYYELTYICSSIGVYGGFAGNETTLASRDWNANETILDGFSSSPVVSISGKGILDGFTVQDAGTSGSPTSHGGGIYAMGSPSIRHNYIQDNSALLGAGIYCDSCTGTAMVIDNIVVDNSAGVSGGGVFVNGGSPIIANNTLVGNADSSTGGGIFCSGGTPTLANNIIALNASGITNSIGSPILFTNDVFNSPGIDYTGVTADTGSICANPQFVDSSGDYHLVGLGAQMGDRSPCIDAGYETTYDAIVPSGSTDMDGNTRIHGPRVDMGAYEYGPRLMPQQPTYLSSMPTVINLLPGDANGDNIVEDQDYSLLGKSWYRDPSDPLLDLRADFNGDGYVEDQDYSLMGVSWYVTGDDDFGGAFSSSTGRLHYPSTGSYQITTRVCLMGWARTSPPYPQVTIEAQPLAFSDTYYTTTISYTAGSTDGQALTINVPTSGDYNLWFGSLDPGRTWKMAHWLGKLVTQTNCIIHVSATGDDGNDGTTWAKAVRTPQHGNDLASAAGGGEVWVSAGTYTTNLIMSSKVALYGGFVGNETVQSLRNWEANPTILDGQSAGTVVSISHASGCTLDGFTIRNGFGGYGGGIMCFLSTNVAIANNVIQGSRAYYDYGGGGLSAYYDSSLIVDGNVFIGNSGYQGGGVSVGNVGPCWITNNTIINNSASNGGGGIVLWTTPSSLANNIVAFNSNGGILSDCAGPPTFDCDDVYGNSGYNYSWTSTNPPADLVPVDPDIPARASGDWRLGSGSPCIDAGDNDWVLSDRDIDCDPRVYDDAVDIGAYEWQGVVPPPSSAPAVVFCIDVTGSMNSGWKAITPIKGLVGNLAKAHPTLLFGAVMFADYNCDSPSDVPVVATCPLCDPTTFTAWLGTTGAEDGGDAPEDDLDALMEAIQLVSETSGPRYIGLATDDIYHYYDDSMGELQQFQDAYPKSADVIAALSSAGCHVFIDPTGGADLLFDCPYIPTAYKDDATGFDLAVGGDIEGSLGTYTFPKLSSAITQ